MATSLDDDPLVVTYRLAVGDFVEAVASLEHTLEYAIVACFPGREQMAEELAKHRDLRNLIDHVACFYPDHHGIKKLQKELQGIVELRNTVVHGQYALVFDDGQWRPKMASRRGADKDPPGAATLRATADRVMVIAQEIREMAAMRPTDYVPPGKSRYA